MVIRVSRAFRVFRVLGFSAQGSWGLGLWGFRLQGGGACT